MSAPNPGAIFLASLCLLGATWSVETDGKYRVYIGSNKDMDWVDVCCKYSEKIELEYADYTPIEEISIQQLKQGTKVYTIRKKWSDWKLTVPADLTYTTLEMVRP